MKDLSKSRKIFIVIVIVLIAVTVTFIWFNSCQSADTSSRESETVYTTVKTAIDAVFGVDTVPITHGGIRKLAHFSEFFLLGAEFSALVIALKKESFAWYAKILPFGVFVAAVDESLQFISKRGPSLIDVLIDFSGFFTAVAIFSVIFLIRCRVKAKKAEKLSK